MIVDAPDWTTESAWTGTRPPVGEATALQAEAYADDSFYRLEQDRVFGTSWVCVGTADEVTPGGRALVRAVGGRSVVVLRNEVGELRCFSNSCRHRGTELLEMDCDLGTTIRCPYHRWTYDRDGQLVATPRFEELEVDGFDPADYSLHGIRIEQLGCLLFATLDVDAPPVDEWFGDLGDRLAGYRLEDWCTIDSIVIDIQANWKLITENFQEYYHLAWVHPSLAKVSRVADHYRYQGSGMYCGQTTTPVTSDDRDDWTVMPAAEGLNESDAVSGRFLALFPNVTFSLLPNHLFVIRLEPLSPGLTREHCSWLVPPVNREVDKEMFSVTRTFWLEVNDEDVDIVERNQRGLTSGGYTPGRFSPRFEEPLHRFHNMLADRMTGTDRIPRGDPSDEKALFGTGKNPLPWTPTDNQGPK